jgi:hypothetical protein
LLVIYKCILLWLHTQLFHITIYLIFTQSFFFSTQFYMHISTTNNLWNKTKNFRFGGRHWTRRKASYCSVGWYSIYRRNTLFHWQSCQFTILVSWRTIMHDKQTLVAGMWKISDHTCKGKLKFLLYFVAWQQRMGRNLSEISLMNQFHNWLFSEVGISCKWEFYHNSIHNRMIDKENSERWRMQRLYCVWKKLNNPFCD